MAVYAIGDLQGCYEEFKRLLDVIRFDSTQDRLWLTGDLVNRGPHSLATLRLVYGLGDSVVTVLGNHDLHLLAMATAKGKRARARSSLRSVIDAPDGELLIDWLRHRPLLHFDESLNKVLVHAGILPDWSIRQACKRAREVEQILRSDDYTSLLHGLYGNKPVLWNKKLSGVTRWRFIVNVFTRMRMLTLRGGLEFKTKGLPDTGPRYSHPWFAVPHKRGDTEVIFGHWSALGFFRGNGVVGLDTGCVWGRSPTALRIDECATDAAPISVGCPTRRAR